MFHSLHVAWIAELMRFLNQGGLPEGYLARAEEYVGPYQSDLLTLEVDARPDPPRTSPAELVPTLTIAPPRFAVQQRQRRLSVFSARDERRVAVIEVVSPGNKDSHTKARWFEATLVEYLAAALHALVVDPLPATGPAPGLAAAVVRELGALATVPAEGRCVTSFERRVDPLEVRVYHRSLTLGQALPDVPLFLEPGVWVDVRLEPSYERALSLLPRHDLKQLEADRS